MRACFDDQQIEAKTEGIMPILRFLVLLASVLQLIIGTYAAYRLLYLEVPDIVGLAICSTIIIAGLASLSGLWVRSRPSLSRRATIKLNMVLLGLLLRGATILIAFEHQQVGSDSGRAHLLVLVALACAAPFLINGLALALIERRMRRLAI